MTNLRNGSQNGAFFIVRAATTTDITLANLQTIDDVVLVAGDLVLVKDQTDQRQNGIYSVVAGGLWTRASNFNSSPKLYPGLFLSVMEGTLNKITYWKLNNPRPIVLGVDNIVFSNFGSGGGGGGIALAAGTQVATTGTVIFSNSNGLTFGMSNSSVITGSYTVPSVAGLISRINISAGTTSNNLSAVTFSNSNGVSFGLNGSVVTASISAIPSALNISAGTTSNFVSAVTFSNANNISFGLDGSTVTASASYSQSTAPSAIVAGTQTATSGSVIFSNSNGISFGMSGSSRITASYTVPSTAGLISAINISGGTTSNNLSALTFSNANNVSFGLDGSTVTASATFPSQTNQTVGLYATGNTTQNSSTTLDARSLSFNGIGGISVGYSNGSIQLSAVTTNGLISRINVSAGTTSNNLSAITFSNANGLSFGLDGSTITASYTVPSVPAQTNQTVGLYALGNTTQNSSTTLDARSLSFNGLGAATVGYSNGSIQLSVPVQSIQTQSLIQAVYDGANSITTGTIRFSNSNGISFGVNGQTITASHNGITSQTNQTVGLYALGNTTQNSSTTLDARSLSFNGLGIITVGYSNGSVQVSATQSAQTQNVVVPSAGTQTATSGTVVYSNSNNITFGMSGSSRITASYNFNISAGTTSNNVNAITFSNSNGLSFGLDGSTITGSYTVPTQSNQTAGLYALGNTTQNSSTTLDIRSLSFNGLGAATVGYSNGSIQVSVPVQTVQTQSLIQAIYDGANSITTGTIRFSNSNGISFGINGQTITASHNGITSQTNQTQGFYAVGNTAGQSSSTTIDARSVTFSGAGVASVGYSNGSVVISVPAAGASINVSAGTTSNNINAITFSNANNVTFGLDGSTITASASYSQSTAPSAIAAGTQTATSGSIIFSNSNGISFGMSGSSRITASYTVPSTAGLISAINVSAGTTSNNLSAITFSNSNGLAFGLDGSTITGSYTVPTQSNQTQGFYAVGNTAGQSSSSTFDARTISVSGAGVVSVGYSAGNLIISANAAGASINFSAGTTSNNLNAITFSNSNGLSFGLNGSTITGSYTVPTQTNQTVGLYALGNTTQNSSTTLDARSLSFNGLGAATVGYSNGSIQVSVPVQTVQTQSLIQAIYDGANSITTGTIRFTNANGVSFSINGQTISGSVAAQTNQTVGLYALGNTTQNSSTTLDARSLSFNGLGAATVGYSNGSIQISVPNALTNVNISAGTTSNNLTAFVFSNSNNVSFGLNGSTVTATVTVPAQTAQTVGLYALGNTTQNSSTTLDARSLSFNGLGAATVGYSNGSIQVSVPAQTVQTQSLIQAIYDGANSISTGTIRFTNANGVSFSINGQTISGSVAAQTAQTVGLYALGNTTQNSSTTLDARSLSFNGLGIVTVGYSNGSIQVSATQSAQTQSNIQAIYDGANSISTGTIRYSNSNGISFGINGQTITASHNGITSQTNQTVGLYALGNTTQNSSTTLDARSLSFNGLGAATVGYSNGSIQVSVPVQTAQTQSNIAGIYDGVNSISTGTIRFTNANGVSFSINGQTISGSVAAQSNQTIGLYAVSNTTGASSSSTVDARSLSFQGAGVASVGYTNGSVVISVPSGGAGFVNISAGTTSNNLTNFVFSNSNSISFGLNGSTITASVGTQNIVFSNSNNISFGAVGSTITASASRPQVSQLYHPINPWETNFPIANATFSLQHFNANIDILATQANLLAILSGNTNSSGALSISLGIYTMSGSTMSLASSDSKAITWTSGSQTTTGNIYGGVSGTRYRTVGLNSWSITAGDYMLGMWFRTTNNGTWNVFGIQGPTIVGALDVNETNNYANGFSNSSYTTAMIVSANVTNTNYVRTGSNALQQPGIIFLGSF